MNPLSEKLKSLRKEKGISQENLAKYLGVTFQAVSKWENSTTMPDIMLLPEIARFFGITVDELLCVEKIDENRLFSEYEAKASSLYRDGKRREVLEIWQEAYKKLPNDIRVKEMLMSAYYDTDKLKYQKEIIELGTEIYYSDGAIYYKNQALEEMAVTYAECGDSSLADYWASKASSIMHCQEKLSSQIDSGAELLQDVRFYTFWAFRNLFYMTVRLVSDGVLRKEQSYDTLETAARLFEELYMEDDAGFETLRQMFNLHSLAAEYAQDEAGAQYHLERACELAIKSSEVEAHQLDLPLLYGWDIDGAPENSKSVIRFMRGDLENCSSYAGYRECGWFKKIADRLEGFLA